MAEPYEAVTFSGLLHTSSQAIGALDELHQQLERLDYSALAPHDRLALNALRRSIAARAEGLLPSAEGPLQDSELVPIETDSSLHRTGNGSGEVAVKELVDLTPSTRAADGAELIVAEPVREEVDKPVERQRPAGQQPRNPVETLEQAKGASVAAHGEAEASAGTIAESEGPEPHPITTALPSPARPVEKINNEAQATSENISPFSAEAPAVDREASRSEQTESIDKIDLSRYSPRELPVIRHMLTNRNVPFAPKELGSFLPSYLSVGTRAQALRALLRKIQNDPIIGAQLRDNGKATTARRYWIEEQGSSAGPETVVAAKQGEISPPVLEEALPKPKSIPQNQQATIRNGAETTAMVDASSDSTETDDAVDIVPLTHWGLGVIDNGDRRVLVLDGNHVRMREVTVAAIMAIVENRGSIDFETLTGRLQSQSFDVDPSHLNTHVIREIEKFFAEHADLASWSDEIVEQDGELDHILSIAGAIVPEESPYFLERARQELTVGSRK